jgi:hypothetical protein
VENTFEQSAINALLPRIEFLVKTWDYKKNVKTATLSDDQMTEWFSARNASPTLNGWYEVVYHASDEIKVGVAFYEYGQWELFFIENHFFNRFSSEGQVEMWRGLKNTTWIEKIPTARERVGVAYSFFFARHPQFND